MARMSQFSWWSSWLIDETNAYAATSPGPNLPRITAVVRPEQSTVLALRLLPSCSVDIGLGYANRSGPTVGG
jgi:hypothetical protein